MDEPQRRARLAVAFDSIQTTAEKVPEPTRSRLEAIADGFEGKTLEEQEAWLRSELRALWDDMAPTASGLYGVLENYIRRQTGMTVEDYVWLRDYERRLSDPDKD